MSGMEIPVALAAAGAGTTAYGTISSANAQEKGKQASLMAAQEQSNAQNFEAGQYDIQGKRIRSAAAADEAARRTDLESSLETIDAMRAGRGLSLDSPTGRAISNNVTAVGERNIATRRPNSRGARRATRCLRARRAPLRPMTRSPRPTRAASASSPASG
jgi:hypothetical protein